MNEGAGISGTPAAIAADLAAANAGDAAAQIALGFRYEHGRGVPTNFATAVSWYKRAADQGSSLGHALLGISMLAGGEGVEQDNVAAIRHLRAGAAAGVSPAQHRLGVCHAAGFGVLRDLAEARRWFKLAAASGDPITAAEARASLADLDGEAGRLDHERAVQAGIEARAHVHGRRPPCAAPGCSGPSAYSCAACGAASYCGKECQKAAWLGHKAMCGEWAAARRTAAAAAAADGGGGAATGAAPTPAPAAAPLSDRARDRVTVFVRNLQWTVSARELASIAASAATFPARLTVSRFIQEADGTMGVGLAVIVIGAPHRVACGEWAPHVGAWPPAAWALFVALVAEHLRLPALAAVQPAYKLQDAPELSFPAVMEDALHALGAAERRFAAVRGALVVRAEDERAADFAIAFDTVHWRAVRALGVAVPDASSAPALTFNTGYAGHTVRRADGRTHASVDAFVRSRLREAEPRPPTAALERAQAMLAALRASAPGGATRA